MNLRKDSELVTLEEITERMESIARQLRTMDDMEPAPSVVMNDKRHTRYCKLVARRDALHTRRARLLQGVRIGY